MSVGVPRKMDVMFTNGGARMKSLRIIGLAAALSLGANMMAAVDAPVLPTVKSVGGYGLVTTCWNMVKRNPVLTLLVASIVLGNAVIFAKHCFMKPEQKNTDEDNQIK